MKSALVKNQNALHYIFTFQKVHFPLIKLTPFYIKKGYCNVGSIPLEFMPRQSIRLPLGNFFLFCLCHDNRATFLSLCYDY